MRIRAHVLAYLFWTGFGIKQFLSALTASLHPMAGSTTWLLFCGSFVLLIVFQLFAHRRVMLRLGRIEICILLIIFWSGLTMLWSDIPDKSSVLGYWMIMLFEALAPIVLLTLTSKQEKVLAFSIFGFMTGAALYGTFALVMSQGIANGRLGNDETLQTNFVGNYMAIAALFSLYLINTKGARNIQSPRNSILAGAFFVGVLIRSLSKTSIGSFGFSAIVQLIFSRSSLVRKAVSLALIIVITALLFAFLENYIFEYLYLTQGGNALESLSGRLQIWEEFLDMIYLRPILGYGFFSIRSNAPPLASSLGHATAHNELLTIWFTLGMIGVIFAVMIYGSLIMSAAKGLLERNSSAALALSICLFALIRGYTEGASYGLTLFFPVIILLSQLLRYPIGSERV